MSSWPEPLANLNGLVISESEFQEFSKRFREAVGWCAPTQTIYDVEPFRLSPTGFIPELGDIAHLGENRHEILERWDEEDRWLEEQGRLATRPLDESRNQLKMEWLRG